VAAVFSQSYAHPSASSALDLHGYSHYVQMGRLQAYLFTSIAHRLPKWMTTHEWDMAQNKLCSKMFTGEIDMMTVESGGLELSVSSTELAIME